MKLIDQVNAAIGEQIEQGTQDWREFRIGKFTASEINRLMAVVKRDMTEEELDSRPKKENGKLASTKTTVEDESVLSDGAMTYIYECVAEVLTGQSLDDSFENDATRWGEQNEDDARQILRTKYGIENAERVGAFVWEEYPNDVCGSPDDYWQSLDKLIEIKCPHNSAIHLKNLLMTDAADMDKKYFWQDQLNLLCSKKEVCIHASYDPRYKLEKLRLKEIEVLPTAQRLLKLKLKLAIEKKYEIIKQLTDKQ